MPLRYTVSNGNGDIVRKGVIVDTETIIDLTSQPSGNYYISIAGRKGWSVKKLIKF